MPRRKVVIATGETYHIFNKTINSIPVFGSRQACMRMQQMMWYYHFQDQSLRFSHYKSMARTDRTTFTNNLHLHPIKVQCLAYVLMKNHYHLLATQTQDNGLTSMIKAIQSGISQWFNANHARRGPVFLPQFKVERITDPNQLLHVGRYIHLNPVTSFEIANPDQIDQYPWSSWRDYMNPNSKYPYKFVDNKPILEHFCDYAAYREFVLDQAEYQRILKEAARSGQGFEHPGSSWGRTSRKLGGQVADY